MNLNTKIVRMGKTRKVAGDIGIEIECETKKPINEMFASDIWNLHNDGSLRGNGYEFVLRVPVEVKNTMTALKEWDNIMGKFGVQFVDSKRASVHVHINVQDKRIIDVINTLCAYWLAEPLLLNIAGNSRKGNLFCLDINCADTVHQQLVQNLKNGSFFQRFSRDAYRYASLNLEALYKFGSLEFRTLRGTQDIKLINTWATELHSLVTRASEYKSPHAMVELITAGKHKRFLRSLFSESFVDQLIKESGYKWRDSINNNVPLVLDVLASRDVWDPKEDEALEKKRLAERTPALPGDDHREDRLWWPDRGRFAGNPLILGAEVGLIQLRFFQPNSNERRWEIWNGSHWEVATAAEIDQSIPVENNQRFWVQKRIHPRAVENRQRRLFEEGRIDPDPVEIPEEIQGRRQRVNNTIAAETLLRQAIRQPTGLQGRTVNQLIVDDILPRAPRAEGNNDDATWNIPEWATTFNRELEIARAEFAAEEEPERPRNEDEP